MLKTALGLAFAAIAQTAPAHASIEVIYPPYAYEAPVAACPPSWSDAEIDNASAEPQNPGFHEIENEILVIRAGHRSSIVVYVTGD